MKEREILPGVCGTNQVTSKEAVPGGVIAGESSLSGPGPATARPAWEEYFVNITLEVAKRSTCRRRHCGALLVIENRILATGYNGAPSKLEHCLERGCLREELGIEPGQRHELCRGLHAEQNALLQAALHGIKIDGAVIYATHQPCAQCSKMLINGGVKKVYYLDAYPDPLAEELLAEADIEICRIERRLAGDGK